MWDPNSLTRDQTLIPCIERWSLNHSTDREVLIVLWLIAPNWKLKCPSTDAWINKTCCSYTMECYLAIKGSEVILSVPASLWANDENILSEARRKRLHIAWFHLYEIPQTGKSTDTKSRLVIARGRSEWRMKRDCYCVWRFFWMRRWNCSKIRWWWQLHKTKNPIWGKFMVREWYFKKNYKKCYSSPTDFYYCNHRNWTTKSKI